MSELQNDSSTGEESTPLPWTVEKCVDVKRALTGRVNNARREHSLSTAEMRDMATLYRAIMQAERYIRLSHSLPYAAYLPEWVRTHGTPR